MGKQILIFQGNELVKHITYKTKKQANGNYKLFIKHGYCDASTGLQIPNCKFELF